MNELSIPVEDNQAGEADPSAVQNGHPISLIFKHCKFRWNSAMKQPSSFGFWWCSYGYWWKRVTSYICKYWQTLGIENPRIIQDWVNRKRKFLKDQIKKKKVALMSSCRRKMNKDFFIGSSPSTCIVIWKILQDMWKLTNKHIKIKQLKAGK